MAIIPIRKPRPFAGARGKSLKELYSAVIGTKGIAQLKPVKAGLDQRYNTEVFVLVKEAHAGNIEEFKTVLYNRMTIAEVFRLAGLQTIDGDYKATAFTEVVQHPLPSEEVIKILNGIHNCDFDDRDVKITHISGSLYTIEAYPKSLGYIGKAEINIGEKIYVPLIPTEHALMESEESTITNNNVMVNDSPVNLLEPEQFKSTGIIFKEFNLPSGKLNYVLNTNDVSLTVTVNGDNIYHPSTNNLNETVQQTRNTFILSPFIEAQVEQVGELVECENRLRMTTWLNGYDELDAIFKVELDGQEKSVPELIASETIEVLKVGEVLEITNLTYQPMNLRMVARTISLPAFEDPSLTFVKFDNQPNLVDGYEVYNLQLAAADLPLTELTIHHHIPTATVYNQLLAKHGLTIGAPPVVKRDMFDRVVSISSLNHGVDGYSAYNEITNIEEDIKTIGGSVYTNGLKFLDVYTIPAADWDKLVDPTNLDGKVITIVRTEALTRPVAQQFSFNDLQNIGVVDPLTQNFVFAFVGYGAYNGVTTFTYPEVAKRHLAGTIELITKHTIIEEIEPTLFFETPIENTERLLIQIGETPEYGYSLDGVEPFTVRVVPTEEDLKIGKVDYSLGYSLAFDNAITPLLDYAVNNADVELTHNIVSFKRTTTNTGKFNLSTIGITVADYNANGFNSLRFNESTNRYHFDGVVTGSVPVTNLDYLDGISTSTVTSNLMELIYEPDTVKGGTFTEVNKLVTIPAVYSVVLTVLEAPTFFFPEDMVDVARRAVVELSVNALNDNDKSFVVSLSDKHIEVNTIKSLDANYHVAIEFSAGTAGLAKLVSEYNPNTSVNIGGNPTTIPLLQLINYTEGDRVFLISSIVEDGSTNIELDVDGNRPHYNSVVSTLSWDLNIIPEPQSPTIVVDVNADLDSQTSLLTHTLVAEEFVNPSESPFDLFKAPLNPITEMIFDTLQGVQVIDGKVIDIDEAGIVGVEFKTFLDQVDVLNPIDPNQKVAEIRKKDTEWKLDLTRNIFKQQTYLKDGEVHFFMLFKINPDVDYNGEYELEIDFDGFGTDDSYILNGVDRNRFYKQKINFILDMEAVYLPVDLESVRVFWAANQRNINALLLNPDDTTYPKDYDVEEGVPLVDLDIEQSGNAIETRVYQDVLDTSKKFTLYIETDITDEIETDWLDKASITLVKDGGDPEVVTAEQFRTQLHRDANGKYFLRRVCTAESAEQSLIYTIDLDDGGKRYKKTTSTLINKTIVIEATMSPDFVVSPDPTWYNTEAETTIQVISPTEVNVETIDAVGKEPRNVKLMFQYQGQAETLTDKATIRISHLGEDHEHTGETLKALMLPNNNHLHLPFNIDANTNASVDFFVDLDGAGTRWKESSSKINVNYRWVAQKYSPAVTWAALANQLAIIDARETIPQITEVLTNRSDIDFEIGNIIGLGDGRLSIECYDNAIGKYTIVFLHIAKDDVVAINSLLTEGKITTDLGVGVVELADVYGSSYVRPFEHNGENYFGMVLPYTNVNLTANVTTTAELVNKYYVPKLSTLALAMKMIPIMDSPRLFWPENMQEQYVDIYNANSGVEHITSPDDVSYSLINGDLTIEIVREWDVESNVLALVIESDITDDIYNAITNKTKISLQHSINSDTTIDITPEQFKRDLTRNEDGTYTYRTLTEVTDGETLTMSYEIDLDGDALGHRVITSTLSYNVSIATLDKPIDCEGAINHAGMLEMDNVSGSVLKTITGESFVLDSNEHLVAILQDNLNLEVSLLEQWTPPK